MSPSEQRMVALSKANEVRVARARMKNEITGMAPMDARRRVAEILCDPPPCMANVRVHELLMCCRLVGIGKAYRFLARFQVSDARRIGTLTERQTRVIANALETPGVLGAQLESRWDMSA